MFRAIGRLFGAIGYLLVGRIDDARRSFMLKPEVIKSSYDEVIREKQKRLTQYQQAVGQLVAQQEKRKNELKNISNDTARFEKLRAGALAKANELVAKLKSQNVPEDQILKNTDVITCQKAFADFSTSLKNTIDRVASLEKEIGSNETTIGNNKRELESILRDIKNIENEKHQAVADIISAQQQREIANLLSGISSDKTSDTLKELRDLRDTAKAEATVAQELSGTSARQAEEAYAEYAEKNESDSEFTALLGLGNTTVKTEPVKLPEN